MFFARIKITDAYLFDFFPRGNPVDPVVLEFRERLHGTKITSSSNLFK